jgi:hypothetical protein
MRRGLPLLAAAALACLAGPAAGAKGDRADLIAACLAAGADEAQCTCIADRVAERLLPADRRPAMAAVTHVLEAAADGTAPPTDAELAAELDLAPAAVTRLTERTGSLLLAAGEACGVR